ncbi:MAG: hypothetical protein AB4041_17180 [Microcystaceae cyanobacterium]
MGLAMDLSQSLIKLVQWLCFTVIIALIPLGFSAFRLFVKEESTTFKEVIATILGAGELLIIAVAIDADAIGEIVTLKSNIPTLLVIPTVAACVLLIAFVSYGYTELSSVSIVSKTESKKTSAIKISVYLFIASLLVSGFCKFLASLEIS